MQCEFFPVTISQWLKRDYGPARWYLLKYLNFFFVVVTESFFLNFEDENDQMLLFCIVNSGVSFYVCS